MINNCLNFIQSLSFPPQDCLVCRQPSASRLALCDACYQDLPFNHCCCQRCARPLPGLSHSLCGQCQQQLPAFDSCFAPLQHRDFVRRWISQFKFEHHLTAGKLLAAIFVRQFQQLQIDRPDSLIAVPLHKQRLRQRGFNQALLAAQQISRGLKIPLHRDSLIREQATAAQHELDRQQRLKNLTGAFSIRRHIESRHIALIDDVITTGSTATEISLLLKQQGVQRVDVWSLSRAVEKY